MQYFLPTIKQDCIILSMWLVWGNVCEREWERKRGREKRHFVSRKMKYFKFSCNFALAFKSSHISRSAVLMLPQTGIFLRFIISYLTLYYFYLMWKYVFLWFCFLSRANMWETKNKGINSQSIHQHSFSLGIIVFNLAASVDVSHWKDTCGQRTCAQ